MPAEEFDLGSSMEEAYNELESGGGTPAEDLGASPPPDGTTPPVASAQQSPVPQQAAPEPWKTFPKSWRKEMEGHWTGLPPEVMQYVHEREKQAYEGVSNYKSQLDKWNKTVSPFQQWFDHYKIDPHEAFNRLATSHIVLKYGKPEDRVKWAQQLVNDYGLADILKLPPQANQPGVAPVQPHHGQEELFQMRQQLQALQEETYQRQLKENMAAVEKFFSDPANEFAAELQEDILKLFEEGKASSLQDAYETAMWRNPAIRDRIMKREVEKATKPERRGPSNVKSSSVSPASTESVDESIEETMRSTLERIKSR